MFVERLAVDKEVDEVDEVDDKGLVYPTVACALSGVVVSEVSRFVALCCRPCRTVIVDRDKLMVSYLLRIFS